MATTLTPTTPASVEVEERFLFEDEDMAMTRSARGQKAREA